MSSEQPGRPGAAERDLREALSHLEAAEEQAGLGSWSYDARTGRGWWSRQMFALFGLEPAAAAPEYDLFFALVHPEDRGTLQDMFARMQAEAPADQCEFRTNPAHGPVRTLSPRYRVERDGAGRAVRHYGIVLDVTERRQVEAALRESNRRFSEIAENISEAFWIYDRARDANIYISPGLGAIWGRPVEEFYAGPDVLLHTILPEDRALILAAFAAQTRGERTEVEYRIVRPDRSIRWVADRSFPVFSAAGVLERTLGVVSDITERKRAEIALRTSEELYRELARQLEQRVDQRTAELRASQESLQNFLDSASDLIQGTDVSGAISYVNNAWCEALGYRREEALALTVWAILDPSCHAFARETAQALLAGGRPRQIELTFRTRAGAAIVVEGSVSVQRSRDGRQITRGIFRDITARKQAEEAMRTAHAEMERALRAKNEFLANMSHELRTPLNAVLALSESLLEEGEEPLSDRQRVSLRQVRESGQHLLGLINDILDLSKVEAGRMELHQEPLLLGDVGRSCLQYVKEAALAKRIQLAFQIDDMEAEVEADPKRLKQILINLLSNAVKFTPPGGKVSLEVSARPAEARVLFMVRDTGIGIPAEQLPRLFQPFTQLDASLSRQHEGSGLGLALARRLAEMHGGTIAVASEVGRGSLFTLSLPLHRAAPPRPAPDALAAPPGALAPAPSGPGATILLADDNEANLQILHDYLRQKGFRVLLARTGREAVQQAEAATPALILMDIQMPDMDGLEAIRRLRAGPAHAHTPIIALTALAMVGDRERCEAAGATAYVAKPISLRALLATIGGLLAAPPQP